jgi:hypothetical protein
VWSSRILEWIPTERVTLRGGEIDEDKVKIKNMLTVIHKKYFKNYRNILLG